MEDSGELYATEWERVHAGMDLLDGFNRIRRSWAATNRSERAVRVAGQIPISVTLDRQAIKAIVGMAVGPGTGSIRTICSKEETGAFYMWAWNVQRIIPPATV